MELLTGKYVCVCARVKIVCPVVLIKHWNDAIARETQTESPLRRYESRPFHRFAPSLNRLRGVTSTKSAGIFYFENFSPLRNPPPPRWWWSSSVFNRPLKINFITFTHCPPVFLKLFVIIPPVVCEIVTRAIGVRGGGRRVRRCAALRRKKGAAQFRNGGDGGETIPRNTNATVC